MSDKVFKFVFMPCVMVASLLVLAAIIVAPFAAAAYAGMI